MNYTHKNKKSHKSEIRYKHDKMFSINPYNRSLYSLGAYNLEEENYYHPHQYYIEEEYPYSSGRHCPHRGIVEEDVWCSPFDRSLSEQTYYHDLGRLRNRQRSDNQTYRRRVEEEKQKQIYTEEMERRRQFRLRAEAMERRKQQKLYHEEMARQKMLLQEQQRAQNRVKHKRKQEKDKSKNDEDLHFNYTYDGKAHLPTTRGQDENVTFNVNITHSGKKDDSITNISSRKIKEPIKTSPVYLLNVEDASDTEWEDETKHYLNNRRPRKGEWMEPVDGFELLKL